MSAQDRLTVLYSTDEHFWDHTFVSIYSLLVNNRDIAFDIRILSEAPNDHFFQNRAFLEHAHGDVSIEWLPIDADLFRDAPASDTITMATYFRLLMDRLIPDTVDRLLYIDGDTVVRGSLHPLLDLDINDVVLAAVPEYIPLELQPPMQSHPERLGLPPGSQCFNAGVLYINLKLWRDLDIGKQCIQYVRDNLAHPARLDFRDQDAMNVVLASRWLPVGPYFNYHAWGIDKQRETDRSTRVTAGSLIPKDGPLVAHYTGPVKPWNGGSAHAFASDYWHYRMKTPYGNRNEYMTSRLIGIPRHIRRAIIGSVRRVPGGNSMLRVMKSKLRPA